MTMIGQTLDRYRIESKLGEGGMGVVYKARDTRLDRVVAIKVLPADKVSDPERRQRFIQEAKAASALNHPNIISVHDVRADAGVDFIVMEYAEGRTLAEIVPAKGLAVAQSLRYGVQIADALARAHEAGIVHRDLKPSNVIVTAEDRVKVLDFGLAKLLEPSDRAAAARTHTSPLTEAGLVVGTAAYMSPEQAEGRQVDARSDIFSFGALLYEMLTGRRPFAGDSTLSVLAKILNDDPAPPSTLAPAVPLDVERAVLRCLRKDPARRFQTMADLKVALEDLAADSVTTQPAVTPAPRGSRSWRWAWMAVMPLVGAAALVGWQWIGTSRRPAPPLRAQPLISLPGGVRHPSFSPDGNHVAFAWTGPKRDNPDIYVQQIGAGSPLQLTTDPASDYSPSWSPDGRAIAFLRQTADPRRHELRLVPPLGGSGRTLTEIRPRGFLRPVTLAWCPDSSCVVVTDATSTDDRTPDALFVVSIESGERRQLTTPQYPVYADSDPAVSPDARWLVFRRDLSPFSGQLQLLALADGMTASGAPRAVTPTLLAASYPTWISGTEMLFSAKGSLWRLGTADGSTPERLPFVGEDGLAAVVSRTQPARLAYVRSYADSNIWRIDVPTPGAPASSPPVVAISSTRRDGTAALSPDGQHVAFTSDRSGENEVWVSDTAGGNAVRLTSMGANPGFPAWSPDGRRIAFQSNPEGQGDVFVVSAEGGKPQTIVSGPDTQVFPRFSPTGDTIYFINSRGGTPTIWKVSSSGGTAAQVSSRSAARAIESPDGQSLYYVDGASDRPGPLWRLPLDGGEPVKLADSAIATAFDVIDRGVYYFSPERPGGGIALRYFDFASGRSTTVATNLGLVNFGLSASRDGRTIFYARVDSSVNDLMVVENFR
jgi:eukaryotic-like serine/threonine-protein kinase